MMATRAVLAGLVLAVLCVSVGTPPARAAGPAKAEARTLRVATGQIPPFVLKQGEQLTGFSIDLLNALGQRLKVDFAVTELGLHSENEQLQAVLRGDADLAISAIAMTPEREQLADFSALNFDSGLQIIVRAQGDAPVRVMIESVLSLATERILLAALLIVLLLANVL